MGLGCIGLGVSYRGRLTVRVKVTVERVAESRTILARAKVAVRVKIRGGRFALVLELELGLYLDPCIAPTSHDA